MLDTSPICSSAEGFRQLKDTLTLTQGKPESQVTFDETDLSRNPSLCLYPMCWDYSEIMANNIQTMQTLNKMVWDIVGPGRSIMVP